MYNVESKYCTGLRKEEILNPKPIDYCQIVRRKLAKDGTHRHEEEG